MAEIKEAEKNKMNQLVEEALERLYVCEIENREVLKANQAFEGLDALFPDQKKDENQD